MRVGILHLAKANIAIICGSAYIPKMSLIALVIIIRIGVVSLVARTATRMRLTVSLVRVCMTHLRAFTLNPALASASKRESLPNTAESSS